jgi:hypothetical protein
MIIIKCSHEEQEQLKKHLENIKWDISYEIIEYGSITDEEIDKWGKFSDSEKIIIKNMYAKFPKGFFKNPYCALY